MANVQQNAWLNGADNDVFFLHPSDSPGMMLVSRIFDGSGFYSWRRNVLSALSAKNKIGFIDGSIVKPNSTSPNHRRWERCNDMVVSWLRGAMAANIGDSFSSGSAEDIWRDVNLRFTQPNNAQLFSLKKELAGISQGSDNIVNFFTKIKKLWDEEESLKAIPSCTLGSACLNACGVQKHDRAQRIMQLLMGLNDVYSIVRV